MCPPLYDSCGRRDHFTSREVSPYFYYWGKAHPSSEEGPAYHLLPFHCLDVAAVGCLLLSPSTNLCQRIAAQLAMEPAFLQRWFTFCLALHDLGKFSRAFQGLQAGLSDQLVTGNSRMVYSERHDSLGFLLWLSWLKAHWSEQGGIGETARSTELRRCLEGMEPWMEIVTGHHGMPPKREGFRYQDFFEHDDLDAVWDFCRDCTELFLGSDGQPQLQSRELKKRLKPVSWQLAGLAVVADWLGSNQEHFHYCADRTLSLQQYWNLALDRAATAVKEAGFTEHPQSAPFRQIQALFPFIKAPTPLQEWAATVSLPDLPQLFILEDVTGAGKTEAAMTLANRLMASGLAEGLYVALPTMATSNAMYRRLAKCYRNLFDKGQQPSLVLAHGARELSDEFRQSVGLPGAQPSDSAYQADESTASAYCNAWIADGRKKALLADIGVGTLDQALLAILPARHQALRLFGLARKVLIVDEVHAYDPYMNRLLHTLIEAHARQGGSVVLLSATLPKRHRQSYVAAFARGLSLEAEVPAFDPAPAFPWITHFPFHEHLEKHLGTRPEVMREVRVAWLHEHDAVIATIRAAVERGECVCWVRNTVRDARASYKAIVSEPWINDEQLTLFHSRFAMADRQRIEDEVLGTFGDSSSSEDRKGRVLIATQVVEQSLDLDFDQMISDIAPVDYLVQRAGRLKRHVRDTHGNRLYQRQSDERAHPVLHVFAPEWIADPSESWMRAFLPGTGAVYPLVGHLWLTQLVLRQLGRILMPGEARSLMDAVYGDSAPDIPEPLMRASDKAMGELLGKRSLAEFNQLRLELGYCRKSSPNLWDEDTRVPTRLTGETVTVAIVIPDCGDLRPYADDTRFAWAKSSLSISRRDWEVAKKLIPECFNQQIETLKQTHTALKWTEVFPLSRETAHYYSALHGWGASEDN